MDTKNITPLFCAMLLAATLTACGNDSKPKTESPRAVKLTSIGMDASMQTRFAASVRQEQRTELAFENGGRIATVLVDVGDHVQSGQVLARLDAEPMRLRLQQAEANLRSATAQVQERRTQLAQQQAMFDDGAISQATLTSAKVALEAAAAQLSVADSELALAQRALRQTEILAPYTGNIVARLQQPHIDVTAGQVILRLEGQGLTQVVATLPAELTQNFKTGHEVQAQRTDGSALTLNLRSLSTRLDNGAGVQAIFDLRDSRLHLRSGESLLLDVPLAATKVPTVPLTAVVPEEGNAGANVFVYTGGVARKRKVKLGNIIGEQIEIRQGLAKGDQIVTAGVAFLADGEPVVPFTSDTRLSTGGQK